MSLKYLYQMFPDENKRRRFIINCALTFGLRAETLAALLNTSVETIKSELLYNISYMHNSMQALFHIGMNNQEEAKQNFIEFFNKLVTAGKSNNKEEISNVLATISDRKAMQIMRREGRGTSKLSDEEEIKKLANEIVEKKMPVRDIEKITSDKTIEKKVKINRQDSNDEYKYIEELMSEKLDPKVKVRNHKIEISFSNTADLNRILEIINIGE